MPFLMILFTLFSMLGWAEVLPTLPAVGAPDLSSASTGDPTFARKLAVAGNIEGSILEWRRIAHTASGAQKAYALRQIGRLSLKNGDKPQARAVLEDFMTSFPKDPNMPEAMYLFSLAVPDNERSGAVRLMKRVIPESPWTQAAVYRALWDYARETNVLPNRDYSDPRAQKLSERLQKFNSYYPNRYMRSVLAIFPGGAHLWFGEIKDGLLYLGVTCLLLWLMVYAYRQKHWPYLVGWGCLLTAILTHSFQTGTTLAITTQYEGRQKVMDTWQDLQPSEPKIEK